MQKTVSLIIPVKDTCPAFAKCLQRIASCSPPPLEVIVVFDGERGQKLPGDEPGNLRVIRLPETGGPGRARNAGARAASGDILMFVDADVIVPRSIIARLAKAFTEECKPDAVFGSYDDRPPEQDIFSQYKNLFHHYTHQHSSSDAFTFWTGCGAVLREKFLELNGFCEEYIQPSIEDIELGYRLKKAGATIFLDKSIQVTHLKKWSLPSLLQTDFFLRAIPWSRLILHHGSMKNDMNINMTSRISVMLSWLTLALLFLVPVNAYSGLAAVFSGMLLLMLNRDLFLFFYRKRGFWFMLRAIPLHFLYFLSSGLAFGVVYLRHIPDRVFGAATKKPVTSG